MQGTDQQKRHVWPVLSYLQAHTHTRTHTPLIDIQAKINVNAGDDGDKRLGDGYLISAATWAASVKITQENTLMAIRYLHSGFDYNKSECFTTTFAYWGHSKAYSPSFTAHVWNSSWCVCCFFWNISIQKWRRPWKVTRKLPRLPMWQEFTNLNDQKWYRYQLDVLVMLISRAPFNLIRTQSFKTDH